MGYSFFYPVCVLPLWRSVINQKSWNSDRGKRIVWDTKTDPKATEDTLVVFSEIWLDVEGASVHLMLSSS